MSAEQMETLREALDMAYDPPSEAHAALDALLAEVETREGLLGTYEESLRIAAAQVEALREALGRIVEYGEERSFSIYADNMARLARAALGGTTP